MAHSILIIAYHVLRDGQSYRDLGGTYFDHLHAESLRRYYTKRLAALGYAVTLTKSAASSRRPFLREICLDPGSLPLSLARVSDTPVMFLAQRSTNRYGLMLAPVPNPKAP